MVDSRQCANTARGKVKHFMETKGKPVVQLSDSKWQSDVAFMADITNNLKLQSPHQPLSSLLSNVGQLQPW